MTVNPTSSDLMAALAKRYPVGQFALLEQVANGTGSRANRWCDAIAMSLWPSRGLDLIGFELKVYRGDWLRELRQPEKAEAIAPYCDRWFVVAPAGLILPGEVPSTWGLLELKGGKLHVTKDAPSLDPKPMTKAILAAVLRRASEASVPKSAVEKLATARAEEIARQLASRAEREIADLKRELAAARAFESASGVKLDRWAGGNVGDQFRRFLEADRLQAARRLLAVKGTVQQLLDDIARAYAQAEKDEEAA